ncbi:hypothetical protein BDV95DRAFT_594959 [Massariosphaeria phaeospora]|uniref:Uncharacterized protein n=1 Tax=Massariosphaeria phaeospora TaxID=100035 RepID=A0A7C8I537_9PLEO|nr:hypothetical protein BDV95DRAFT_594959 [Massariosphaeria phaeospora]
MCIRTRTRYLCSHQDQGWIRCPRARANPPVDGTIFVHNSEGAVEEEFAAVCVVGVRGGVCDGVGDGGGDGGVVRCGAAGVYLPVSTTTQVFSLKQTSSRRTNIYLSAKTLLRQTTTTITSRTTNLSTCQPTYLRTYAPTHLRTSTMCTKIRTKYSGCSCKPLTYECCDTVKSLAGTEFDKGKYHQTGDGQGIICRSALQREHDKEERTIDMCPLGSGCPGNYNSSRAREMQPSGRTHAWWK